MMLYLYLHDNSNVPTSYFMNCHSYFSTLLSIRSQRLNFRHSNYSKNFLKKPPAKLQGAVPNLNLRLSGSGYFLRYIPLATGKATIFIITPSLRISTINLDIYPDCTVRNSSRTRLPVLLLADSQDSLVVEFFQRTIIRMITRVR